MSLTKKKQKVLYGLLIFLVAICLFGCGNKKNKNNTTVDNTLYEKGLDIVKVIDQMQKSEAYESLYLGSGIEEVITSIRSGNYTKPCAVFELRFHKDYFSYLIENEDMKLQDMPEDLRAYVKQRAQNQFTATMNARTVGAAAVAASGVYQATKTFLCKELEEDTIYMYVFEAGFPIVVSFNKGDDGTVCANGSFLITDSFHMTSEDDVKRQLDVQFSIKDVTVREVRYSGEK